jgi:hypothetical protein
MNIMKSLFAMVCLLFLGCGEKPVSKSTAVEEAAENPLVGEIAETVLAEMRYKRITDGNGGTVQGGADFPHQALKMDAEIYKPLAVQWAGIKSLDAIPGHRDKTFFRYKIIAELYPDAETAQRRDAEFDATYRKHVEREMEAVSKTMLPVTHFSHGRVFYLLTTDIFRVRFFTLTFFLELGLRRRWVERLEPAIGVLGVSVLRSATSQKSHQRITHDAYDYDRRSCGSW